jgi:hypothetical protein
MKKCNRNRFACDTSTLMDEDKDTFLTSVDGIQGSQDSESMKRVMSLHGKLTGVVDTLSAKVSGVLQKQEKEFLQAYRAHMYNVQKELQQLRSRLDDAEMSLKKNDKIRKLEEARDWFREEALRLVSVLKKERGRHPQKKQGVTREIKSLYMVSSL